VNTKKLTIVTAAFVAFSAQAQVSGSAGAPSGSFLDLLNPVGFSIDPVAGAVRTSDINNVTLMPLDTVTGSWLSAGSTQPHTITLSFNAGLDSLGFRWGSPDLENSVTFVTSTFASLTFTAADLGLTADSLNGSTQYVNFTPDAGFGRITSVTFAGNGRNAFEASDFTTSPIPEPSTYALMFAGLAAVSFVARRRRG
jgi:hypothetical protein